MREILFRGKTYDGKWEQGDLRHKGYVHNDSDTYIMRSDYALHNIPVDPETVGQYTGLTDKNGKKIFEGDIVKKHSYTDYDNYANSEEYIGIVAFSDCAWTIETKKISHPIIIAISYTDDVKHFEVIGNIHDNPELIGE